MAIKNFFLKYPWFIPTVIFAVLVIGGSLAHQLWGDEAETAFFAKTILQRGLPYGWDGANISSIVDGALLNSDLLNNASPWLQFYLVAFSFKLFGISSFTARLPFILMSIASIPLLYKITRVAIGKSVANITTIIASVSVPFILFSYQARYYPLTVFSLLLLMYPTLFLTQKKTWPKLLFFVAGILGIFSHYFSFIAFFISWGCAYTVYLLAEKEKRKDIKKFLLTYSILGSIIGLIFSVWYFYLKPGTGAVDQFSLSNSDLIVQTFYDFLSLPVLFNENGVFPYLFILPTFIILAKKIKQKEKSGGLILIGSLTIFYLLVMTFFASISRFSYIIPTEIRYNVILFPLFFMLSAIIFDEVRKWNKYVFFVLIVLYVTTTIFSFQQPQFYLHSYINEIINPYKTADEEVAKYLKIHAKTGESIFINSDRAHDPLIFLLGDKKLHFINRVTATNPKLFPKNYKILPKYIYSFLGGPDWVVLYSTHINNVSMYDFDLRDNYPAGFSPVALEIEYEKVSLPIFYGSDVARPETGRHKFYLASPKEDEKVFIFKKRK